MQRRRLSKTVLVAFPLVGILGLTTCSREHRGVFFLRWIERPPAHGPADLAAPQDQVRFVLAQKYDLESEHLASWPMFCSRFQEGDVIAYRMTRWEADTAVITGQINKLPYRLCRYGHLAILVKDPEHPGRLTIFSSEGFKGPNIREELDTLREHRWDLYRLDQRDRIDTARLNAFVAIARQKAENWTGYDFTGMFGLWNAELHPDQPEKISKEYICSTVVLAALHYAGVALDAERHGGVADIVTPQQVVASRGRIIPPPQAEISAGTLSP